MPHCATCHVGDEQCLSCVACGRRFCVRCLHYHLEDHVRFPKTHERCGGTGRVPTPDGSDVVECAGCYGTGQIVPTDPRTKNCFGCLFAARARLQADPRAFIDSLTCEYGHQLEDRDPRLARVCIQARQQLREEAAHATKQDGVRELRQATDAATLMRLMPGLAKKIPTKGPLAAFARHAILQLDADDPDHAAERNDVGFAQCDVYTGHRLAAELRAHDALTEADWVKALQLANKYHRQVGEIPTGDVDAQ